MQFINRFIFLLFSISVFSFTYAAEIKANTQLLNLSKSETAYLQNKKNITMCIDPNWMPFEKFDKNGNYIGISADYYKLFEMMLPIKFKVIQTKTWSESLQFGKERKCEIMSLMMETQKRKEFWNFTSPYLIVPLVLITKPNVQFINNIKELQGEKIGIAKGYAFVEILKNRYPSLDIVEVENIQEGLDKVNSGELYTYVGTLLSVGYQLQTKYFGELKIAGKVDQNWELGIGVRNDDPILLSIMQKTINNLTLTHQREIFNKWLSVEYSQGIDYDLIWKIILFFMILLLIFIYFLRKQTLLKNKLAESFEKTTQLSNEYQKEKTKYKYLMDNSADALFIVDLDAQVIEYSKQFKNLLGYDEKEILELHVRDFEAVHTPKEINQNIQNLGFKPVSFETKYRKKDNSLIDVSVSIVRITLDEQDYVYVSVRDITEQKKLQNEILNKKEEFESIFKNSKDGIAILDLESNFLECNHAYSEITGFTKEELLTKSCIGLTAPEDQEVTKESLKLVFEKGYIDNFEKECIVKNDKRITANMSISLLPDKKRLLLVTKDVTNLKILEEQSKNAALGEMIGNIAHQWRQPLSVISSGATGMLVQKDFGNLDDEEFKKMCKLISDNAQYLSKTIDDFRNFVKGDREKKEFDLNDSIESFLHLVEGTIKSNEIEIVKNIQDNVILNSYQNELLQCYINIFNNAKDALKECDYKKYIFISVFTENNKAVIIFKDNAGGIPDKIISHVFEPYFTTKHQSFGTGLGLHMTYSIITEGLQGTIQANNSIFKHEEKDYAGAEFTITLPLN